MMTRTEQRLYLEMFGGTDGRTTRAQRGRLYVAGLVAIASALVVVAVIYGALLAAITLFDAVTR
jgi:hypothetical protein